jgi:long-chain fatty acid transport protein
VAGLTLACLPFTASGAVLELPVTTARDAGMYATSAVPTDPVTALAANPAGLTRLEGTYFTLGLQTPIARFRYEGTGGYDHMSSAVPLAPNFGLSTERWRPWYFAIGAFGNLGMQTDFPADPAGGIPRRLKNGLAVIKFAPTVAYRVSPQLSVGASLLPAFGWQEVQSFVPVPGVPIVELDADGPGIAAQFGVLAGPWHGFSFGFSYRTEGRLWLSGTAKVDGTKDGVDVTYDLPQSVVASLAYEARPNLTLAMQMRWTDWTALNDSEFDFSRFDFLDRPISRHTDSVTAIGAGIEYTTKRGVVLRAAVLHEPRAVDRTDLSPTLIDTSYTGVSVGLGYRVGVYQIDLFAGVSQTKDVDVAPGTNPFPGTYSTHDSNSFGIQITRVWESR